MDITITIPDQVWQEDKDYPRYFEAIQFMVNRMAMSHFKYGIMGEKCQMPGLDDMLGGRKRLCMYDGIGPEPENKPIDTGNTENLLDAANFFILEHLYPKHSKAHFRAQSSKESPGLAYRE